MWAQVINNCRDVYSPLTMIDDDTLRKYYWASYSLAQTYNNFVLNYYMCRGHEGENPVFNNNSIKVNRQPLQPVTGWGEGDPNIVNNLTLNNVTNPKNSMLSVREVNQNNNVKLSKKKNTQT